MTRILDLGTIVVYTRPMASHSELWLSVALSSPVGTVALHEKTEERVSRFIGESVVGHQYDHSERFIDTLESLLHNHHRKVNQLGRLITTSGPGSFTGLRIAFASLKAISFALQIPIETIDGSEARALAWLKNHPSPPEQDIFALTHASLNKFTLARLKRLKDGVRFVEISQLELSSTTDLPNVPGIFLLEEKSAKIIPLNGNIYLWPLKASHLGETLLLATSRKTHSSLSEWINLSPDY